MRTKKKTVFKKNGVIFIYKRAAVLLISTMLLLIVIGAMTSVQPAYRISSQALTDWTRQMNGSSYFYLMEMESKSLKIARPENIQPITASSALIQLFTSIKQDDPRTLLGTEIPGFAYYENQIIVAGEGTDYTNLPIESEQPELTVEQDQENSGNIQDDQEDTSETEEEEAEKEEQQSQPAADGKEVVFIYQTHNQESYLPSLDSDQPENAYNKDANVTDVSEKLAERLEELGIGATSDNTDIAAILSKNDWEYYQSYDASREVVETALADNKDIQFVFDVHRDSLTRENTTKEIDGETYAKVVFVVGAENKAYEKNLELATTLHNMLEEAYPGISRGVITKKGAGVDGIYNQDVSENAALIEIGGVENTLEEAERTAAVFAEIFADYYWDAEKVQGGTGE